VSTLEVTRAEIWEQIEEAAGPEGASTCIGCSKPNWNKAKNTWEQFGIGDNPDVLYFIVHAKNHGFFGKTPTIDILGYVRLLNTTQDRQLLATWVVDFVRPSSYTPIILASQQLRGTVLAPRFGTTDDICTLGWSNVTTAFPKITEYPYRIRSGEECTYLVVPKYSALPAFQ
jgi:hypothetical protein